MSGEHLFQRRARELAKAEWLGLAIGAEFTAEIEGGIATKKQDFITEKLYSPLNFYLRDSGMLEYYDDNNYWRDELSHRDAWGQMDAIELAIRRDRDTLDPERGLMEYCYDSESLNAKAHSLFPSIELQGDKLWCVATVKLTAPLTAAELAELKENWCGQLSDGNGKCLSMRSVGGEPRGNGICAVKRFA